MVTMKDMLRDIGVLLRGSLIAQGIGLLFMPILSRLYSPADFGDFGLFQAAMILISVTACLRYDQAILTAKNESDALALYRLCILLAVAISVCVCVVVLVMDGFGLDQALLGSISLYWLVPTTFLSGMALASTSLFTRLGNFQRASSSRVVQSLSNSAVATSLGLASPFAWGLVLADSVGKVFAIMLAMGRDVFDVSRRDWLVMSIDSARRFASFPRVSVLGGLLNNGGYFVTRAALFTLFGAEVNGQFALADRVISLPLGLIIVAVSQVFTSHYGRLLRENPGSAQLYLRENVRYAAFVGLVPFVLGMIFAPTIFPLIFGSKWVDAGKYAQVMAIMYYSSVVSGPVQSALVVSGHMKLQLFWEASRLLLLLVLWLLVAWQGWTPNHALAGYAIVSAAIAMIYVFLAWTLTAGVKNTEEGLI